jgi:hypothetical protein
MVASVARKRTITTKSLDAKHMSEFAILLPVLMTAAE